MKKFFTLIRKLLAIAFLGFGVGVATLFHAETVNEFLKGFVLEAIKKAGEE